MQIIFLIAFLYLFWELINRANPNTYKLSEFDKAPAIRELANDIIESLAKKDSNPLLGLDSTDIYKSEENKISESSSVNSLLTEEKEKQVKDQDSNTKETLISESFEDDSINLFSDESISKVVKTNEILDSLPIDQELSSTSSPVSRDDIQEWTKRNQKK